MGNRSIRPDRAAAPHLVVEGLWLSPNVVTKAEESQVLRALDSVPRLAPGLSDPREHFAFSRPLAEGVPIVGRKEAAAGDPIWFDGGPTKGMPVPGFLLTLQVLAQRSLDSIAACGSREYGLLTSVYVDEYERGGYFVPHIDRPCYGPAVVGISLGPATSVLTFSRPLGSSGEVCEVSLVLPPRSLYVFAGRLRNVPWSHGIHDVNDRRFGITFRSKVVSRDERQTGVLNPSTRTRQLHHHSWPAGDSPDDSGARPSNR